MEQLELKILRKRQFLRDLINQAVDRNPVPLDVIRLARMELAVLDFALEEIYRIKASPRVG